MLLSNYNRRELAWQSIKQDGSKWHYSEHHPKSAFEKLYGYTNNPDTGIRHALIDDTNIPTSAEATYMLVTCSAFINYLNTKNI